MKKLDYYWGTNKDWWYVENGIRVIRPDAPPKAQESYKHFLEQSKDPRYQDE